MSIDPPEIQTPDAGSRGARRFHLMEFLMSAAALVVSATSIAVALHHGEVMEKLVTANSLPYVQIVTASATARADGGLDRQWSMQIRNVGVGPADVTDVQMRVDGRPVGSLDEWLAECCSDAQGAGDLVNAVSGLTVVNNLPRHFIPSGGNAVLFAIPLTDVTAPHWDQIGDLMSRSSASVCYCSVFDECWITDLSTERHEVAACAPSAERFRP